jgi:ADP-ribose pyrophosphatase
MVRGTIKQSADVSSGAPKRITDVLDRVGNEYAWIDKLMVDWGDGKPRLTYRAGIPDGVHVLALLDNGNVLLVHQYRVLGRGWVYELPGGIIDKMESEEDAVIRELEEETGYHALQVEKLCSFNPVENSLYALHIYIARKLEKRKRLPARDENEVDMLEVTPTQLYAMVLDGTMLDAKTIIATLLAKERGFLKVRKAELKKGHAF